jgi:cysteine desulfurase / selenocysteine lyase
MKTAFLKKNLNNEIDLCKIKDAFIGTDLIFKTIDNKLVNRIYLDSAASSLALKSSQIITQKFLKFYSNTHSTVHLTAEISNEMMEWSQERIIQFVGADKDYSAIFIGSGATAPINRIAKGLSQIRPNKKTIVLSIMEHHSNDLPHRMKDNKIVYLSVLNNSGDYKGIQLTDLENILIEENGNVNYVSVTGASNVTGHITPIYDIAKLAHKYGAYIIVDGAQLIAHSPVKLIQEDPEKSIDFFVFSGHKIYTPGSPGVLIGRNDLLEKMSPESYGGGMVDSVSLFDFELSSSIIDREQAGTPNITGIISIAATVDFLDRIGMDLIYKKEIELTSYFLNRMSEISKVKIYPNTNLELKIGVISFNINGMPHQLLAKVLNDYFGIAVRNDCFCAHPFVRECLIDELWDLENEKEVRLYKGMVRASLGLYSSKEDIDTFIDALKEIEINFEFYSSQYRETNNIYEHISKSINAKDYFDINKELTENISPYIINNLLA